MAWKKLITRKDSFLVEWLALLSLRDNLKKSIGWGFSQRLLVWKNDSVDIYECIEEVAKLKSIWQDKIYSPNFLFEFYYKHLELANKLLPTLEKLQAEDLTSISNTRLLRLYLEFCHRYSAFLCYLNTSFAIESLITPKLQAWLKKELKNQGKEETWPQLFSDLALPQDIGIVNQQEIDLFKITARILARSHLQELFQTTSNKKLESVLSKINPEINLQLKSHIQKYKHLSVINEEKPWDKKHFLKLIRKSIHQKENIWGKLIKNESYPKKIQAKQRKIIHKLKLPLAIQRNFEILREMAHIRDWRRNIFNSANLTALPLLQEIGKRLALSSKTIKYLTPNEVADFLKNNRSITNNVLTERMKFNVVLMKDGIINIYAGEKAKKVKAEEISKDKINKQIKKIKGVSACKGKVRGKVKLVLNTKEINKVEYGNIIVSEMTGPHFIPAIKKAAAIITDEGGVLCHAAIISRELNVPCIINTKFATKILKDGDIVQVNANDGEIYIK